MTIRYSTLPVGMMGNIELELPLITIGSGRPKTTLVTGIHGNETAGLFAIDQLLRLVSNQAMTGELCIIAGANPMGLALRTRIVPGEHQDLNRIFPGSPTGTFPERLAYRLLEQLKTSDFVVDLHTFRQINPIMAVYFKMGANQVRDASLRGVYALTPAFVWEVAIQNRADTAYRKSLGPCLSLAGIPNCVVEFSFLPSLKDKQILEVARGLQQLLVERGMLDGQVPTTVTPHFSLSPYYSESSGLFYPSMTLMQHVTKGDIIGELVDGRFFSRRPVLAAASGQIVQYCPRSLVDCGSNLYVLGNQCEP